MICDRLIHIHVPRTGGTMFRTLLYRVPGLNIIDDMAHLPYAAMVTRFDDEIPPAIAFIRNPWEWYVSQWCWVSSIRQRDFQGDFVTFMNLVQHNIKHRVIHPNFRCLSFWWNYLQAEQAKYIGHFEYLHEDIVSILLGTCGDLIDRIWIREQLADIGVVRPGITPAGAPHGPYQEYYTEKIAAWVAGWDAELIERFNYVF